MTTPIYYVTAKPHLGSLYSTILADVASRWNKLLRKKTFFLTGTDEHGQKIAQAAQNAGMEPKAFVDSFIEAYHHLWKLYSIGYDKFIRTTDHEHVKAVQHWITLLEQKGDIYKSFYKGWYCTPCETFLTETDINGPAPSCPTCGRPTQIVSEESYFFKLSQYQDRLLELYEKHPEFIIPKERAHEVINFVRSGLKDLSISRTTITWGIPFPHDPGHVTYVWADALNNYITAVGWGDPHRTQEFKTWWPANLQVLGKDIIRFHAVYWPAFLMATELEMPEHLLVHGWIKVNAQKMSKSFGNVVDPVLLHNDYGTDPVRYYLTRYMAITHDSEFSIADLEQKIGSDLANDLGNLLNRMLLLAEKHKVKSLSHKGSWNAQAAALKEAGTQLVGIYAQTMDECMFHIALAHVWKFINDTNAYFHAREPWKLAKDNQAEFEEVLSATCHSLYTIAILLWPIMPQKMELLLQALGKSLPLGHNYADMLAHSSWNETFVLNKIEPLFHKPEPKVEKAMEKPQEVSQTKHISIDDLTKVELIVGTIKDCQTIPKSEKALSTQR